MKLVPFICLVAFVACATGSEPCPPGQRFSGGDECIDCAAGTYNAGDMLWDAPDCFEIDISQTPEIKYNDATSVVCNRLWDYWGTPVYAGGEYESGCQECDESLGCPTAAPSTSPTPAPSDSPTKSPTAAPTASPTQASCNDDVLNGDESAVDCGGGMCNPCGTGAMCEDGPRDCASGVCTVGGTCAAPTAAPTAPPTTAAPTQATAELGLRGGTVAPTAEKEEDDGMSTSTRVGVVLGGIVVIAAITFFSKMSKSRRDKRAEKDRNFVRRMSSARGDVGTLTANPLRSSPSRSESSANVEQASSEPPVPPAGGGDGGGDESPTLTNDTLELAVN